MDPQVLFLDVLRTDEPITSQDYSIYWDHRDTFGAEVLEVIVQRLEKGWWIHCSEGHDSFIQMLAEILCRTDELFGQYEKRVLSYILSRLQSWTPTNEEQDIFRKSYIAEFARNAEQRRSEIARGGLGDEMQVSRTSPPENMIRVHSAVDFASRCRNMSELLVKLARSDHAEKAAKWLQEDSRLKSRDIALARRAAHALEKLTQNMGGLKSLSEEMIVKFMDFGLDIQFDGQVRRQVFSALCARCSGKIVLSIVKRRVEFLDAYANIAFKCKEEDDDVSSERAFALLKTLLEAYEPLSEDQFEDKAVACILHCADFAMKHSVQWSGHSYISDARDIVQQGIKRRLKRGPLFETALRILHTAANAVEVPAKNLSVEPGLTFWKFLDGTRTDMEAMFPRHMDAWRKFKSEVHSFVELPNIQFLAVKLLRNILKSGSIPYQLQCELQSMARDSLKALKDEEIVRMLKEMTMHKLPVPLQLLFDKSIQELRQRCGGTDLGVAQQIRADIRCGEIDLDCVEDNSGRAFVTMVCKLEHKSELEGVLNTFSGQKLLVGGIHVVELKFDDPPVSILLDMGESLLETKISKFKDSCSRLAAAVAAGGRTASHIDKNGVLLPEILLPMNEVDEVLPDVLGVDDLSQLGELYRQLSKDLLTESETRGSSQGFEAAFALLELIDPSKASQVPTEIHLKVFLDGTDEDLREARRRTNRSVEQCIREAVNFDRMDIHDSEERDGCVVVTMKCDPRDEQRVKEKVQSIRETGNPLGVCNLAVAKICMGDNVVYRKIAAQVKLMDLSSLPNYILHCMRLRMVIIGDTGAGKTSFAEYLMKSNSERVEDQRSTHVCACSTYRMSVWGGQKGEDILIVRKSRQHKREMDSVEPSSPHSSKRPVSHFSHAEEEQHSPVQEEEQQIPGDSGVDTTMVEAELTNVEDGALVNVDEPVDMIVPEKEDMVLDEAKFMKVEEGGNKADDAAEHMNVDEMDAMDAHTVEEYSDAVTVHVWDCGGDDVYQNAYRFLVTSDALLVIVVNMSRSHSVDDIEQRLDYWLQWAEDRIKGRERLLIVGTHATDKGGLEKAEQVLRQKVSRVMRRRNEGDRYPTYTVVAVDSKSTNDAQRTSARERVLDTFREWLHLEQNQESANAIKTLLAKMDDVGNRKVFSASEVESDTLALGCRVGLWGTFEDGDEKWVIADYSVWIRILLSVINTDHGLCEAMCENGYIPPTTDETKGMLESREWRAIRRMLRSGPFPQWLLIKLLPKADVDALGEDNVMASVVHSDIMFPCIDGNTGEKFVLVPGLLEQKPSYVMSERNSTICWTKTPRVINLVKWNTLLHEVVKKWWRQPNVEEFQVWRGGFSFSLRDTSESVFVYVEPSLTQKCTIRVRSRGIPRGIRTNSSGLRHEVCDMIEQHVLVEREEREGNEIPAERDGEEGGPIWDLRDASHSAETSSCEGMEVLAQAVRAGELTDLHTHLMGMGSAEFWVQWIMGGYLRNVYRECPWGPYCAKDTDADEGFLKALQYSQGRGAISVQTTRENEPDPLLGAVANGRGPLIPTLEEVLEQYSNGYTAWRAGKSTTKQEVMRVILGSKWAEKDLPESWTRTVDGLQLLYQDFRNSFTTDVVYSREKLLQGFNVSEYAGLESVLTNAQSELVFSRYYREYIIYNYKKQCFQRVVGIPNEYLLGVMELGKPERSDVGRGIEARVRNCFSMLNRDGTAAKYPDCLEYRGNFDPLFFPMRFALKDCMIEQYPYVLSILIENVCRRYWQSGVRYVEFSVSVGDLISKDLYPFLSPEVALGKHQSLWKQFVNWSVTEFPKEKRTHFYRFLIAFVRNKAVYGEKNSEYRKHPRKYVSDQWMEYEKKDPQDRSNFLEKIYGVYFLNKGPGSTVQKLHEVVEFDGEVGKFARSMFVGLDLVGLEDGYPFSPFLHESLKQFIGKMRLHNELFGVRLHAGEMVRRGSSVDSEQDRYEADHYFIAHMRIVFFEMQQLSELLPRRDSGRVCLRVGHGLAFNAPDYPFGVSPPVNTSERPTGSQPCNLSEMRAWLGERSIPLELNMTSNDILVADLYAEECTHVGDMVSRIVENKLPFVFGTDDDGVWPLQKCEEHYLHITVVHEYCKALLKGSIDTKTLRESIEQGRRSLFYEHPDLYLED